MQGGQSRDKCFFHIWNKGLKGRYLFRFVFLGSPSRIFRVRARWQELGFTARRAVVVDPLPDAEAQLGFQLPELGTRGEVVAQSIAGEDRLAGRQQGPGDGAALIFRNVGEIRSRIRLDRIELASADLGKDPVSKAKRTLGTAARVTSTTVEAGGHGAATIQKLCAVLGAGDGVREGNNPVLSGTTARNISP